MNCPIDYAEDIQYTVGQPFVESYSQFYTKELSSLSFTVSVTPSLSSSDETSNLIDRTFIAGLC
jgi:hypothetical protein